MRSFERCAANVAICALFLLLIPALAAQGQQGGPPNYAPGSGPSGPPNYSPEQNIWASTYRQALRIAGERRRLVLIHFWDDNCPPCRSLERNVFGLPEVQRAMSMNYIPVRVNVSDDPALARQFNVTRWPTDVVVSPDGTEVFRSTSEQDPNRYIAFLDRVASSSRVGMVPARDPNAPNISNETVANNASARDDNGVIPRNYDDRLLANNSGPPTNQNYQPAGPQQGGGPQQQPAGPPGGAYQPPDNSFGAGNNDPRYSNGQNRWQLPNGPQNGGAAGANFGQNQPPNGPNPTRGYTNDMGPTGQTSPNTALAGPPSNNQRFDPSLPAGNPANDPRVQQNNTFAPNGAPPPADAVAGVSPNVGVSPSGPPSMALDGYCPVTLIEQKKWKKGDPRFGAEHRFRTYVFASQAEQQKFMANPDKFSPMLSGYDPVLFADQHQFVFGKRQHGVTFGDQMYLFTDEASLQQFWKQPQKYVRTAQEAMRSSSNGNIQR